MSKIMLVEDDNSLREIYSIRLTAEGYVIVSAGDGEEALAMAVKELMDYLENGNIKNSVNYPACDMGVCTQAGRISIFHKNVANMITRFAALFGEKGINISDMINKSKGEVAYTMLDVEEKASEEIIDTLRAIPGVFRVRVVK